MFSRRNKQKFKTKERGWGLFVKSKEEVEAYALSSTEKRNVSKGLLESIKGRRWFDICSTEKAVESNHH